MPRKAREGAASSPPSAAGERFLSPSHLPVGASSCLRQDRDRPFESLRVLSNVEGEVAPTRHHPSPRVRPGRARRPEKAIPLAITIFPKKAKRQGGKPCLFFLLDSSFVETYSKHKEKGAEYSGFKKKTGFKLHSLIDFDLRLPLRQLATGGARHDITIGKQLIRGSPKRWPVEALSADKGYDGCEFVMMVFRKWKGIKI